MQDYIYLHKSPQKNSISIRQNDNTLIITQFLYSQLLSHQVGFLGISGICNISKYPISPIFACYLSRSAKVQQTFEKRRAIFGLSSAYLQVKRSINDVYPKDHLRFLRFLRFCRFSKTAITAITAHSRSVLIYDNLNNIPRTNAVRGWGFTHCQL